MPGRQTRVSRKDARAFGLRYRVEKLVVYLQAADEGSLKTAAEMVARAREGAEELMRFIDEE